MYTLKRLHSKENSIEFDNLKAALVALTLSEYGWFLINGDTCYYRYNNSIITFKDASLTAHYWIERYDEMQTTEDL